MQRYFVKDELINGSAIEIVDSDFHHIKNVMRMRPGDEIVVIAYSGSAYAAKISEFRKNSVLCLIEKMYETTDSSLNLTLAQALIRKDNFELVLQKATELGIRGIIPLKTTRSMIKTEDNDRKQTRYETIVKEAAEQSERTSMPTIFSATSIEDLPFSNFDRVLVAYERHDKLELKSIISGIHPEQKVLLVVGPEGGFTANEIEFLAKKGELVSLGNTILRSETAAIYFISAFRLLWGENR